MIKLNRRKFCECGCGIVIKSGNRFARGHNNARLGTGKSKSPPQHCACGCGQMTNFDNKYINNHHHGKFIPPPIPNHHPCACGKCNKMIASNLKFAHGHNRSGKNNWENKVLKHPKPIPNYHLCECGCGRLIASDKRFAKGHLFKGLKFSGMTGKHHTKESKKKISQSNMETKSKNEFKLKVSEITKTKWNEIKYRIDHLEAMKKALAIKPNKPETQLRNRFLYWHPNIIYCGDFSIWVNGKNPDFICEELKKIIEFNGNYWHQNDIPGEREKIFAKFGYDTLILVDEDLLDIDKLKIKVDSFMERVNPYENNKIIGGI